MAVRRLKCEECGGWFSTFHPHQRFCTDRCRKQAEYWRYHVEPYLLPAVERTLRPWMFCRAGDCDKCPGVLSEGSCCCTCHVEEKTA